jgi:FMN-dependent oxidoreductase (nitrilotriacetate monooxygenase family)
VLLVPLLAAATEHIGIVVTMSTSFYPPFLLARSLATLDHLTHGRVGWNVVTSSGDRAAQNYGLDHLHEHDLRYEMADEFTELVFRLWDSWEPDALLTDAASGRYVDHAKVHTVDFNGRFHRSRGPLNTLPPVQGRPVICQAGGSAKGLDFAAKYADTIIAVPRGARARKAFRVDVRARAARFGRDPDDIKVLFVTMPILGETHEEAVRLREAFAHPSDYALEGALSMLSVHTEIDFSQFDLDQPLPPKLTTNGHQTSLKSLYGMGRTVREIGATWIYHYADDSLVGTPGEVADAMAAQMEEVGGDGFLINAAPITRQYISQVTEGLAPALRARGLMAQDYPRPTFRENLLAF